jgi:hypothetical protein
VLLGAIEFHLLATCPSFFVEDSSDAEFASLVQDAFNHFFKTVLAHAKEVIRHVVIEKEILHLFLRRCGSLVRVIHKATAIAHLRIEDLASGKRFIGLYQIQDFVGHLVVCPPRHITQPFINDDRVDVTLFLEHAAAIDRKHSTRLSVGQQFDTVEIKKLHNLAFFSKIME